MDQSVKPKVMVNATTLVVGGGIQVGYSFVEMAAKREDFDFLFLVSPAIYQSLSLDLQKDKRVVVSHPRPSLPLQGLRSRHKMRTLEKQFQPDVVYSIGFPSYIRFRSIEIGRYTNPMEINPPPLPWAAFGGLSSRIRIYLGTVYRQLWARRVDYLETQTLSAKNGIINRLRFPANKVIVVPNSANDGYVREGEKITDIDAYLASKSGNMIFCLSAGYPHKNLQIIPRVAKCLLDRYGIDPRFILTLPLSSPIWHGIEAEAQALGVSACVQSVGALSMRENVDYFKKASAVFLPTLLEVFSATYLESMCLRVPLVTSDLSFSRDVCGDAASFFDPYSPDDAAEKLNTVLRSPDLQNQLVQNGLRRLKSFPSNAQKYDNLFSWIKDIALFARHTKGRGQRS